MQFTVIALGTRGDVTPLVAIAARLQQRGDTITLATHQEFAPMAERHRFAFRAVPGSFQDFLARPQGRRALGVPNNSPLGVRHLLAPFAGCAAAMYAAAWAASAGADGLIGSPLAAMLTAEIARRRRRHVAIVMATPAVPTRNFAHPVMPQLPFGRVYKRATWAVAGRLLRHSAAPVIEAWQHEAAQQGPPLTDWQPRAVTIVSVSPHLLQRPSDWPADVHLTGFCYPPAGTEPQAPGPDVQRFVDGGPPPLVLGFGSMADDAPDQLRTIVRAALTRLRMRAVIVGGSGGALAGLAGTDVCEVPFVDYDWLFPRAAAVVHQGGAGTLSYALRAGVPHVTVPYCLDHAFWTHCVQAAGVAPPPLGRHRLTAERLANRVGEAIGRPQYAARARLLAPRFREEDGAGRAAEFIAGFFAPEPPAPA